MIDEGVVRMIRSIPTRALLAVGVVAGGLALALVALLVVSGVSDEGDGTGQSAATSEPEGPQVRTRPLVHRPGGFRLKAPRAMDVVRQGQSVRLTTRAKDVAITVAPLDSASMGEASAMLLESMRGSYAKVSPGGTQRQQVHGRPAIMQAGQVENSRGTSLRFVTFVIELDQRSVGMTAFTAAGTSPEEVLPLVNEVANTIRPVTPG